MTRALITTLLLVALASSAAPVPAVAQGAGDGSAGGQRPPTELWDEFPLRQPPRDSAKEGGGQAATPAADSGRQDGGDGGSSGTLPLALGGLAILAAVGAAAWFGVVRRRRGVSRAATEPPTAAPVAKATPEPAAPPASAPAVAPVAAPSAPQDGNGASATPAPAPRPAGVAGQRAVGYASVSAADDLNNAELKVQVRLIQEACQRRGLTLVKIVRDVESHASSDLRRPGLTYALDRLAARDASCIVVASLERLTRTAANLGALLGWLTECDARLIVIDLDLDTGTEEGQLGARALATVGGLERRKIEERTRKGLEAARNMRRSGRPAVSDRPSLKQRIADMRAEGMTLQAIADTLNDEGVPTLRGGAEWRPSSVQAAAGYKRPRRKGVLRAPAPPRNKGA